MGSKSVPVPKTNGLQSEAPLLETYQSDFKTQAKKKKDFRSMLNYPGTCMQLFSNSIFTRSQPKHSLHGPYLTLTSTMTPQKLDTTPPIPKPTLEITRISPYREKFRGSEFRQLRIGIFFDKVQAIYTKHIIVYIAWKNNFQKKFS